MQLCLDLQQVSRLGAASPARGSLLNPLCVFWAFRHKAVVYQPNKCGNCQLSHQGQVEIIRSFAQTIVYAAAEPFFCNTGLGRNMMSAETAAGFDSAGVYNYVAQAHDGALPRRC